MFRCAAQAFFGEACGMASAASCCCHCCVHVSAERRHAGWKYESESTASCNWWLMRFRSPDRLLVYHWQAFILHMLLLLARPHDGALGLGAPLLFSCPHVLAAYKCYAKCKQRAILPC